MHTITVAYVMGSFQTFLYGEDKQAAQAAFDTINSAIAEWKRFKNDTSETVTVQNPKGTTVFRIEHLASVDITDMGAHEPEQAQWSAYLGKLKAVEKNSFAAALIPADVSAAGASND